LRQRILRSPFPEVVEDATRVEQTVMTTGRNAISTREHAPVRAWIQTGALPVRRVLVQPPVRNEPTTLLGLAPGRAHSSVLPPVPLRQALQLEVAGISRPITLCGHADDN